MLCAFIFDRELREGLQRVSSTRATGPTAGVHGRCSSCHENQVLIRLGEDDGSSETWLKEALVEDEVSG